MGLLPLAEENWWSCIDKYTNGHWFPELNSEQVCRKKGETPSPPPHTHVANQTQQNLEHSAPDLGLLPSPQIQLSFVNTHPTHHANAEAYMLFYIMDV